MTASAFGPMAKDQASLAGGILVGADWPAQQYAACNLT